MTVLTIGTFDLFHAGHMELLQYCKKLNTAKLGDIHPIWVGINTDAFVTAYKKMPPYQSLHQRWENVVRFAPAPVALHENNTRGSELIRELRPDILVVGMDWLDNHYADQIGMTQGELSELGIIVAFAPRTTGISSSLLKGNL